MSLHDYKVSREVVADDPPFYALIMAAMRRADSTNLALLREMYPEVWAELDARYNSVGGYLPRELADLEPTGFEVDGVDRIGMFWEWLPAGECPPGYMVFPACPLGPADRWARNRNMPNETYALQVDGRWYSISEALNQKWIVGMA